MASVFGSEMATRAYSEAATHADLDDTEEGEEAEHGEETCRRRRGGSTKEEEKVWERVKAVARVEWWRWQRWRRGGQRWRRHRHRGAAISTLSAGGEV